MVDIEDNVGIFVYAPVNDLFYAVHPCGVDIEICISVGIPGNRYADSVEALCLDSIYQRFCGLGVAPVSFGIKTQTLVVSAVMGIECVAQIPAHAHIGGYLEWCHF